VNGPRSNAVVRPARVLTRYAHREREKNSKISKLPCTPPFRENRILDENFKRLALMEIFKLEFPNRFIIDQPGRMSRKPDFVYRAPEVFEIFLPPPRNLKNP